MLMFPAIPGILAEKMKFMPSADLKKFENTGAACNWYSLPSIVGTNTYVLGDIFQAAPDTLVQWTSGFYCSSDPLFAQLANSIPKLKDVKITPNAKCPVSKTPPGHMSMTIVARFDTPNSGFGHVYFEGEKGGSRFAANAPIALSR